MVSLHGASAQALATKVIPPAPVPPTPAKPAPVDAGTRYLQLRIELRQALEAAPDVEKAAKEATTALKEITNKKVEKGAELEQIDAIEGGLKKNAPTLVAIRGADTKLATLKTDLDAAFKAASKIAKPSRDLRQALGSHLSAVARLNVEKVKTTAAKKALGDGYGAANGGVVKIVGAQNDKITALRDLAAKTVDAQTLRIRLAKDGGSFADVLDWRRSLEARLTALKEANKAAGYTPSADPVAKLDPALKAIVEHYAGWLKQLDDDIAVRKVLIAGSKPEIEVVRAEVVGKEFEAIAQSAVRVREILQKSDPDHPLAPKKPALEALVEQIQTFVDTKTGYATAVAAVGKKPPLNITDWVSEEVPLFYFNDVARLIQVLNAGATKKGSDTLAENAASQQQKLDEATQDLLNARSALDNARTRVASAQNSLQVAQKSLLNILSSTKKAAEPNTEAEDALQAQVREQQHSLDLATSKRDTAKRVLDRAQAAATAAPTDAAKAAQLVAAQQTFDTAQEAVDAAQADLNQTKAELALAQGKGTQASAEAEKQVEAAKTSLESAKSALATAQTAVDTQSAAVLSADRAAFLAAQLENAAFANARDNAPFWVAMPDPTDNTSTDPVKRVMLYAFPDSKSLFVRGKSEDVSRVRQMIADFDQASGQALLTVWNLEMSSNGTTDGARNLTKALQKVDKKLAVTRIQTTTALSCLQGSLNHAVNAAVVNYKAEQEARIKDEYARLQGELAQARKTASDARIAFTLASNALQRDRNDPAKLQAYYTAEDKYGLANYEVRRIREEISDLTWFRRASEELEIVASYDHSVLERLGWRDYYVNENLDTRFLRNNFPIPTKATTLAEVLVVLSLLDDRVLSDCVNTFNEGVEPRVQAAVALLNSETTNVKANDPSFNWSAPSTPIKSSLKFPNFQLFVGKPPVLQPNGNSSPIPHIDVPGARLLAFRNEIVEQLSSSGLRSNMEYFQQMAVRLKGLQKQQSDAEAAIAKVRPLLEQYEKEQKKLWGQIDALPINNPRRDVLMVQENAVVDKIIPLRQKLSMAQNTLAILPNQVEATTASLGALLGILEPGTDLNNKEAFQQRIEELRDTDINELLATAKGFRNSDRFEFSSAREAALNEELRGYVRAINDDIQRQFVEPMFYDLHRELSDKKNGLGLGVLQRTSVIASNRLVAKVDPKASASLAPGETQNALQDAQQLTKFYALAQTGGLSALLGGFENSPPEAPPAVYGLSTGNRFQITPIADPTGQSLRFRFDYVQSTQLREPNGTIDPQIPRIERQSINTEVQLQNQDVRLISQFNSNAQLGLPTRRSGGIPVVKDLPIIKEVPLLGWFVKRKGKAAVVQQNLVMGQATMLPSVGDIIHLLTRPVSLNTLSPVSAQSDEDSTPPVDVVEDTDAANAGATPTPATPAPPTPGAAAPTP